MENRMKKSSKIAGLAAAAAVAVGGVVLSFSPETDQSRTLGSEEQRWAGIYAPWISDGTVSATVQEIRTAIDHGGGIVTETDPLYTADKPSLVTEKDFSEELAHKADLVGGVIPMSQLPRAATNITLYIAAAGVDSPTTTGGQSDPFATIQAALNFLANTSPGFKSEVVLNIGPGTFSPGRNVSNKLYIEHLKIIGSGMQNTALPSGDYRVGTTVLNVGMLSLSNLETYRAGADNGRILNVANVCFTSPDDGGAYTSHQALTAVNSGIANASGILKYKNSHRYLVIGSGGGVFLNITQLDLSEYLGRYAGLYLSQHAGTIAFGYGITVIPPAPSVNISITASDASRIAEDRGGLAKYLSGNGTVTKDATSFIQGVS